MVVGLASGEYCLFCLCLLLLLLFVKGIQVSSARADSGLDSTEIIKITYWKVMSSIISEW